MQQQGAVIPALGGQPAPPAQPARRIWVHSYALTPEKAKFLAREFPDYKFEERKGARDHKHALLALTRQITEEKALAHLSSMGARTVSDVGGNVNRHYRTRRTHVWTLAPIVDPMDHLRSMRQDPMANRFCRHRLQECAHTADTDGLLFVHSIYYFSPLQILHGLMRTKRGIAVSVHHPFIEPRGMYAHGECAYTTRDGAVTMTVNGESPSYMHSACRWLLETNYFDDGKRAMCWKPFGHTHDVVLMEFSLCPRFDGYQTPKPVGLRPCILDPSHYGPVDLRSPLNESPTTLFSTSEVALRLKITGGYSMGPWLSFSRTDDLDIFVPKHLIFDVAKHVVNLPRDSNTHRTATAFVKRRIDKLNIPPDEVPTVMNVAINMGFTMFAEQEVALLEHYIQPRLGLFERQRLALAFQFAQIRSWGWKKWAGAIAVAYGAGWLCDRYWRTAARWLWWIATTRGPATHSVPAATVSSPERFWAALNDNRQHAISRLRPVLRCVGRLKSTLASIGLYLRARTDPSLVPGASWARRTAVGAVVLAGLYIWWTNRDPPPPPPTTDPHSLLDHAIAPELPDGVYSPFPRVPPREYPDRALTAIDQSARVMAAPFEAPKVPRPEQGTFNTGVAFAGFVPTVVASSHDNEYLSVHNRACAAQAWDTKEVDSFREFVITHFGDLFPGFRGKLTNGRLTPWTYDAWNSRFPPKTRTNHDRARSEMKASPDNINWRLFFRRKTFVKVEKRVTITADGEEEIDPRTIQGFSDMYNVCTGPFIKAFDTFLRSTWSSQFFLYWTSGSSAEDVGTWFDANRDKMPVFAFIENDYSRFDATVHKGLFEVLLYVLMRLGSDKVTTPCSLTVHEIMRETGRTFGLTAHGVRYAVEATVSSGHPGTSSLDTAVNALATAYIICKTFNCTPRQLQEKFRGEPTHAWFTPVTGVPNDVAQRYVQRITDIVTRDEFDIGYVDVGHADVAADALVPRMDIDLKNSLNLEDAKQHVPFVSACFNGDDGGTLMDMLDALQVPFAPTAARLGLRAKTIIRAYAHLCVYCSSLFWPTEHGTVMGPMIGKLLTKVGWAPKLQDAAAYTRGVALGLQRDTWFVPIVRAYIDRMLQLTEDHEDNVIHPEVHRFRANEWHNYNNETIHFMHARYGVGFPELSNLIDTLAEVKAIPATISWSPMRRLTDVDGVTAPEASEEARAVAARHDSRPAPGRLPRGARDALAAGEFKRARPRAEDEARYAALFGATFYRPGTFGDFILRFATSSAIPAQAAIVPFVMVSEAGPRTSHDWIGRAMADSHRSRHAGRRIGQFLLAAWVCGAISIIHAHAAPRLLKLLASHGIIDAKRVSALISSDPGHDRAILVSCAGLISPLTEEIARATVPYYTLVQIIYESSGGTLPILLMKIVKFTLLGHMPAPLAVACHALWNVLTFLSVDMW